MNQESKNSGRAAGVAAAVAAVNAELDEPPRIVGEADGKVRFELFQAGISICSQKVRVTLIEKGVPFLCHELNPAPPDKILRHHFPAYVRMRMLGALPHLELVSGFSGATSVATDGLEPTVVPTLVDHEAGRVVLDSRVICNYIDTACPAQRRLIPEGLEDETEKLVDIVDRTPHPSLLMGGDSPLDRRPEFLKHLPIPDAETKISIISSYLEDNRDDPVLERAYAAKIAREEAIERAYSRDGRLEETVAEVRRVLALTEDALGKHQGPWLLGEDFTIADIHMTLNLFRLQNVGFGEEFGPRTKAYTEIAYRRPSIVKGMVAWPVMTWFFAPEYFDREILSHYVGPKPR